MLPNTGIPVAEVAAESLQPNTLLGLISGLSVPTKQRQVWTSAWIESVQAGIEKGDSLAILQGYQRLTEQLNSLLQQPYPLDEHKQNDWISALLRHLLGMHVYQEIVAENCPHLFIELKTTPWVTQATQVLMRVPQEAYLRQLCQLVEYICKQSIDSRVDRALLKLHQHTVTHCFQQFLDRLLNPTQGCLSPEEEYSVYKPYIYTIAMLHSYTTQLSKLPSTEKEAIPNLLLKQLTELIEKTSTLDLTPSWTERLKEWIQRLFKHLQLGYVLTSGPEASPSSKLLVISRRLKNAAKKALHNKNSQSIQLIQERCWLYFSLHEQLLTQWWREEKYTLEYHQSIALALFETFISTFNRVEFKERVLRNNPLKPKPNRFFKCKRKRETPVRDWEPLVDIALEKLCEGFFIRDWCRRDIKKESFILWLVSRHKPRLIAKIKDYIARPEVEFQHNKILFLDKLNLYRFVQEIHEDFCADLNQVTQMILITWFQEMGCTVSRADLGCILVKPGRWLHSPHTNETRSWKCVVTLSMLQAIERLGAGLYFFPHLEQRWSALQEALATCADNPAEFFLRYYTDIKKLLHQLLLLFHPDHQPEATRDHVIVKQRAARYLPQIKDVKHDLQKFIARNPEELQAFTLDVKVATACLLNHLEDIVLDCMLCYVVDIRVCRGTKKALDNIKKETKKIQEEKKKIQEETKKIQEEKKKIQEETKKIQEETKKIQEETKKIQEETKKIQEETEAAQTRTREAQAEVERLKALLAELTEQTLPQPSLARSQVTLFSASNAPLISTSTATKNPVLTEYNYAP
jgi:Skp family chaperone for outer membrane proteins